MWSTPAVWKQYNKMAVLLFFPVNSSLYILFSMDVRFRLRSGKFSGPSTAAMFIKLTKWWQICGVRLRLHVFFRAPLRFHSNLSTFLKTLNSFIKVFKKVERLDWKRTGARKKHVVLIFFIKCDFHGGFTLWWFYTLFILNFTLCKYSLRKVSKRPIYIFEWKKRMFFVNLLRFVKKYSTFRIRKRMKKL